MPHYNTLHTQVHSKNYRATIHYSRECLDSKNKTSISAANDFCANEVMHRRHLFLWGKACIRSSEIDTFTRDVEENCGLDLKPWPEQTDPWELQTKMNHERAGTIVADPYENDRGRLISPSSTIKSRLVAADDSGLAVRLNAGVSTASTEIFL